MVTEPLHRDGLLECQRRREINAKAHGTQLHQARKDRVK
jgi:hypothetical protein